MEFRKFGKSGWDISVLGLGLRHPKDEKETCKLIEEAIKGGINCIDLGYPFDEKEQERKILSLKSVVGKNSGDRVKVILTIPVRFLSSKEDFDRYLSSYQQKLSFRIELCLFSLLNKERWARIKEAGFIEWVEEAKKDGRIGLAGFSLHDEFQTLRRILEEYEGFGFCQFEYSILDIDHHPGIGGIKFAFEKGLGVIASQPLKSGRLVGKIPEGIRKLWEEKDHVKVAEFVLRWILDHEEISTIILGTGDPNHLKEAIEMLEKSGKEHLDIADLTLINRIRETYRKLRPVQCLSCYCCMPCPLDIDVPRILELYNDAILFENIEIPLMSFREEAHRPELCNECGLCEKSCPRQIKIMDWLKKARKIFQG